MNEITLFGFNNLTKNLSFSLYKLHYICNQHDRYNRFIKERFSADKLNGILTDICRTIGGNVLNIAKQDYHPQGASVTLMMSEEFQPEPLTESLVAHLDKSHLCIHTYPEESPQDGIAIFRADIELSTCGVISPLKVLNHVIEAFDADVIDIDYRIRGMTRDKQGKKLYNLDQLDNVSDHLSSKIINHYTINEHNFCAQNLFHAKLSRNKVNLNDYIFEENINTLSKNERCQQAAKLKKEIQELSMNTN